MLVLRGQSQVDYKAGERHRVLNKRTKMTQYTVINLIFFTLTDQL